MEYYTGLETAILDGKNKLSLPKTFKDITAIINPPNKTYYAHPSSLIAGPETVNILVIYDELNWGKKFEEFLERPSNDLERLCFVMSKKIKVNSIGRINLTKHLTRHLGAKAKDMIAYIGNGDCIIAMKEEYIKKFMPTISPQSYQCNE
ncbi:MAG: hypothetical protein Q8O89_00420 [Nanoarchaeota archaeon]|nr:hypothetical protein [Nanoarchaeota archaeon]